MYATLGADRRGGALSGALDAPASVDRTMNTNDSLQRFLFEGTGIRGEIVRLDQVWREILSFHAYPKTVSTQLGQALAAVALLSATIKFDGALILQAQGNGPIGTLVAQATSSRTLRGLARWQAHPVGHELTEAFGEGRLVLTVQNQTGEPYQGIVPLEGDNLAQAIENYFAISEQLPTRLWLAADSNVAAGLLLQVLPDHRNDSDDWNRLSILGGSVRSRELLELDAATLLRRLFNEETVRVFRTEPLRFACTCSRQRIETILRSLPREELEETIKERGSISVDCEFCNQHFEFDPIDVGWVMRSGFSGPTSSGSH